MSHSRKSSSTSSASALRSQDATGTAGHRRASSSSTARNHVPDQAASKLVSSPIYSATYSGIPVWEIRVANVDVMRRCKDSYLNATQILKVANIDKPQRTKILEREVQTGVHEKVQGGYGKYQGTWVPFERGVALAVQYQVSEPMRELIEYRPETDPVPPPAPKKSAGGVSQVAAAVGAVVGGGGARALRSPASPVKRTRKSKKQQQAMAQAEAAASAAAAAAVAAAHHQNASSSAGAGPHPLSESCEWNAGGPDSNTSYYGSRSNLHGSRYSDASPGRDATGKVDSNGQGHPPSHQPQSQNQSSQPGARRPSSSSSSTDMHYQGVPHYMRHNDFRPRSGNHTSPAMIARQKRSNQDRYRETLIKSFLEKTTKIPRILDSPPSDFEVDLTIDNQGHTSLHWGAALARIDIVKALLTLGAQIAQVNLEGQTALMRAVLYSDNYDERTFPDLLDVLYPTLYIIDNSDQSVLHHIATTAGEKGKVGASRYYLACVLRRAAMEDDGVDQHKLPHHHHHHHHYHHHHMTAPTQNGAHNGDMEPIPLPVNLGHELELLVNHQDKQGDTALHIALRRSNRHISQILLDIGARTDIVNNHGETAAKLIEHMNAIQNPPPSAAAPASVVGGAGTAMQSSHVQDGHGHADSELNKAGAFVQEAGAGHQQQQQQSEVDPQTGIDLGSEVAHRYPVSPQQGIPSTAATAESTRVTTSYRNLKTIEGQPSIPSVLLPPLPAPSSSKPPTSGGPPHSQAPSMVGEPDRKASSATIHDSGRSSPGSAASVAGITAVNGDVHQFDIPDGGGQGQPSDALLTHQQQGLSGEQKTQAPSAPTPATSSSSSSFSQHHLHLQQSDAAARNGKGASNFSFASGFLENPRLKQLQSGVHGAASVSAPTSPISNAPGSHHQSPSLPPFMAAGLGAYASSNGHHLAVPPSIPPAQATTASDSDRPPISQLIESLIHQLNQSYSTELDEHNAEIKEHEQQLSHVLSKIQDQKRILASMAQPDSSSPPSETGKTTTDVEPDAETLFDQIRQYAIRRELRAQRKLVLDLVAAEDRAAEDAQDGHLPKEGVGDYDGHGRVVTEITTKKKRKIEVDVETFGKRLKFFFAKDGENLEDNKVNMDQNLGEAGEEPRESTLNRGLLKTDIEEDMVHTGDGKQHKPEVGFGVNLAQDQETIKGEEAVVPELDLNSSDLDRLIGQGSGEDLPEGTTPLSPASPASQGRSTKLPITKSPLAAGPPSQAPSAPQKGSFLEASLQESKAAIEWRTKLKEQVRLYLSRQRQPPLTDHGSDAQDVAMTTSNAGDARVSATAASGDRTLPHESAFECPAPEVPSPTSGSTHNAADLRSELSDAIQSQLSRQRLLISEAVRLKSLTSASLPTPPPSTHVSFLDNSSSHPSSSTAVTGDPSSPPSEDPIRVLENKHRLYRRLLAVCCGVSEEEVGDVVEELANAVVEKEDEDGCSSNHSMSAATDPPNGANAGGAGACGGGGVAFGS